MAALVHRLSTGPFVGAIEIMAENPDSIVSCSHFVLMAVKTLGEAWRLGWRVKARCFWTGPNKSGRRQLPWCDTTVELDMVTLVWTRARICRLRCSRSVCAARSVGGWIRSGSTSKFPISLSVDGLPLSDLTWGSDGQLSTREAQDTSR